MYYIYDNYVEEFHPVSFAEFGDAEKEMKRLIKICKENDDSYDFDIYQKIT